MTDIYLVFICLLLMNMAVIFSRLPLKKNSLYFLLSIQLFGTNGISILLLFSGFFDGVPIIDLALVATLLASVTSLIFIQNYRKDAAE